MKLSQKVSVVVLSRNRQQYLRRQINYWKNYSIPLIIIDQSPAALDTSGLIIPVNIRYLHRDESLPQRLVAATELIETPYAIFLPDDEFHIESCLLSCVEYLETHRDYASCAGRSLAFLVDTEVCCYTIYENLHNFSIISENPFERVQRLAHPYKFQPIHAVSRTSIWRKVASLFDSLEGLPPDMFELVFGFTAAYEGKMKVIPELMNMRSRENEPVHTPDWNQKARLPVWLFDEEKLNAQLALYKRMSELEDRLTEKGYTVALSVGIIHYLFNTQKSVIVKDPSNAVLKFKRKLKELLPKALFYELKKIKHSVYIFFGKNSIARESLMTVCKRLENQNVKVNFKNVHDIQQVIEVFHGLR